MNTRHKVGAFVIRPRVDAQADLLLFTHVDFPDAPIQIPGGGIEPAEDPYAAVLRELHEEAGIGPLPLIRTLGLSETPSIVNANERLLRHCYLFDGSGLPDEWEHVVTGGGEDRALRFAYRWHRIAPDFTLSGDLGHFLNPAAIPELYAPITPGIPRASASVPHLFFDLDGTLTDPFEGIAACLRHALRELGRADPADAALRECIGPPLREGLARLLATDDPALIERAVALYRDRFSTAGLFENTVYPEIPALLATLRAAGHTLHVVTSKPTVYARRILDHFDLAQHFTSIHGEELGPGAGDKARLVANVLAEQNLRPDQAVMIGDRSQDVRAARAHGVPALGVLWGYGSREELVSAGAAACLTEPGELPDFLRDLAPPP